MGLSRSRTITLTVACATLSSNILSSILFRQLPDDPYHLASNSSLYLHFANVASVFGFIGALRQHALSVTIFAHYLILDTIISSVPRLLILTLLNELSPTFCALSHSFTPRSQTPLSSLAQISSLEAQQYSWTGGWSPEGCAKIIYLSQLTLAAGVIMATILQFVGALYVREYGKALSVRDSWVEARQSLSERRRRSCEVEYGLHIIDEEMGEMMMVKKM